MRDLRFAMIGAGFWAPYQLAAWREIGGTDCVAVCDLDRNKAETLAQKFGIAHVYDNAELMFAKESLDFVDIVTSVPSHQPLVMLAAQYGIATICQKPLGESFKSSLAMVRAYNELEVPLLVHENFRWQRPIRELQKVLSSNTIGQVFRASVNYCSSFSVYDNQPFLRDLESFILTDVGTHILDIARFLFGEAESLYSRTHQVNPTVSGEDVATVMLAMQGGSTVIVEMSYASLSERERFPETYVFVEGERGSVELAPDYWIRVTTSQGTHARRVPPVHYGWADPEYDLIHDSTVGCNRNLLDSLRNGSLAETTAEDNLETLRLVFGAYASAESNTVVQLKPQKTTVATKETFESVHHMMGQHTKTKNSSPHA